MTIYAYTGTPGTGKSLDAAREICLQLNRRSPRPVIGNFPINPDAVRHPEMYTYMPNWEMSAERIERYCDDYWTNVNPDFKEDFITLVIDECQ